ncbi:MAG: periplasmic heavy metal sensor [Pseudomonadota bacterium]
MKKTLAITTTLLMIVLIAGSVFAWGPGKGHGMEYGSSSDCPGYNGQDDANLLSQEQKDQLSSLRQKFIDETYQTRAAKFAKVQEMRMLMETSDPDRTKLAQLSNEILELEKGIMDKKIDFRLEMKKIAPELSSLRGGGFGKGRGMWSSDNSQGRQGKRGGCGNF